MPIVDILVWMLVSFGAANGMAHSSLTHKWRTWFHKKTNSTFFHCVMCQAFWTGLILSLTWMSPTGFWLWDAFLSSAGCWLIYLGIMNRQSTT